MVDILTTGAINWDINLFVKEIECSGVEMPVERITRVPGGKAANVAVAVARLLGKKRCGIVGALGDDDIGKAHRKIFEDEGVDTRAIVSISTEESGQAYILIDSAGRNKIYTHFGANAFLSEGLIDKTEISEVIKEAEMLVAMDPPIPYARALFERFRGKRTIWAPGVRTLVASEQIMRHLKFASYLVLNEQELLKLAGTSDPEMGFSILSKGAESLKLIVTLGEHGAMLVEKKGYYKVDGVDLAKAGLHVINTVGCGDAFIGCFAASVVEGMSDKSALERANYAGAYKATKQETRGSPTRRDLEEFIHMLHR